MTQPIPPHHMTAQAVSQQAIVQTSQLPMKPVHHTVPVNEQLLRNPLQEVAGPSQKFAILVKSAKSSDGDTRSSRRGIWIANEFATRLLELTYAARFLPSLSLRCCPGTATPAAKSTGDAGAASSIHESASVGTATCRSVCSTSTLTIFWTSRRGRIRF